MAEASSVHGVARVVAWVMACGVVERRRAGLRLSCRRRHHKLSSTAVAMIACFMVLQGFRPVALAADAAKGRAAAGQCTVCHGKDGLATVPDAPNLAGESAIYIEKQLMAFKRGERQHRQMSLIAGGLEDQTIKDLGAWYESMQVTVVIPEQ